MGPDTLGEECEAFLTGRYLDWLRRRHQDIPAWVWLNGLAHGTVSDVGELAAATSDRERPSDLVADMASAALDYAQGRSLSLASLQRAVLLPIEAKLRAIAGSSCPDTASDLAAWLMLVSGRRSLSF